MVECNLQRHHLLCLVNNQPLVLKNIDRSTPLTPDLISWHEHLPRTDEDEGGMSTKETTAARHPASPDLNLNELRSLYVATTGTEKKTGERA